MADLSLGSAIALQGGTPKDYSGLRLHRDQIEFNRDQQRQAREAEKAQAQQRALQDASKKWEKDVHIDPNLYHKIYQPQAKQIYSDYLEKAYNNWKSGNGNANAQLAIETNFKLQPLLQNSSTAFKLRDDYLKGDFSNRPVYEALESGDINRLKSVSPTAFGQWGGIDNDGNIGYRKWDKFDYTKAYAQQNLAKETQYGSLGTLIPGQKKFVPLIKAASLENVKQIAESQWDSPGADGQNLRSDVLSSNEPFFKQILAKEGLPNTDMDIRDPESKSGQRFLELGKEWWIKDAQMHLEKDIDLQQVDLDQPKSDGDGSGDKDGGVSEITDSEVLLSDFDIDKTGLDDLKGSGLIPESFGTKKQLTAKGKHFTYVMDKPATFANPKGFRDAKTGESLDTPGVTVATFGDDQLLVTDKEGKVIPTSSPDHPNNNGGKLKNGTKWSLVSYGTYKTEVRDETGKIIDKPDQDIYVLTDTVTSAIQARTGKGSAAYRKRHAELKAEAARLNSSTETTETKSTTKSKPQVSNKAGVL